MAFRLAVSAALAALASASSAPAAAAPCFGPFNHTYQRETPCFKVLAAAGDLSVREFVGGRLVTLVEKAVSSSVTIYQEAVTLGTYDVLASFVGALNSKNESLVASRTVPLVVRPPTPQHDDWLVHMALAPSLWPAARARVPPRPGYNVTLAPLGSAPVAVQYRLFELSPQPEDLAALCRTLGANLAALGGWAVDAASPVTYSYAFYSGYTFYDGPWDVECWAGVVPV
jgi:hypothetical protein